MATKVYLRDDVDDLRDFVENAVVPLHRVGPDGTILWANNAELSLLGYAAEEYIGHHIAKFHADQPVIDDILERLGSCQEIHDYEARLRAKDGTIKHVLISSSAYSRDGKFIHTRCFTRDITERKRGASPGLFETSSRNFTFKSGEGLPGKVWHSRSPAGVGDLSEYPDFHREQLAAYEGLQSSLAFPIQTGDSFLGVMVFFSRHRMGPDQALLDTMAVVGNQIGHSMQRERAEEQLRATALDNARLYEAAQQEIAERKRAELALRESEEQLKRAMDMAQMGAWQWDIPKGTVAWSSGLEKIHGRAPGSFGGTFESVLEDFHPDDVSPFRRAVEAALHERKDLSVEYRILWPDGSMHWLEAHGRLEVDSTGAPLRMRGTCMNITERRAAEDSRREAESAQALSAGLLHGQEEERRRLARDLHDDFSQRLAVLTMEVDTLRQDLSAMPHATQGLQGISKKLVSLADDIRRISHQLHPAQLEYTGLSSALRSECTTFAERDGVEVCFVERGDSAGIPKDARLVLYRIAQEAFRNIARHAKATCVDVVLECTDAGSRLRIQDDGAGFDASAGRLRHGLGLISMQERVRAVSGSVQVASKPGSGTTVSVFVPERSEAASPADSPSA